VNEYLAQVKVGAIVESSSGGHVQDLTNREPFYLVIDISFFRANIGSMGWLVQEPHITL
jgi:hypothetical protein